MDRSVNKFVLLGKAHHIVIDDLKKITLGSTFLYAKDNELRNTLEEAFAEMALVVHKFKESHDDIVANGTPELDTYTAEFNSIHKPLNKRYIVELHTFDLSTYFKCFIILVKAVLDKLVPLYSYSFNDNLRLFSKSGTKLINAINGNKHISKPDELISLIESAKSEWIGALIGLRDKYAHYSSLTEYCNFWFPYEMVGKHTFTGIGDFHKPTIRIDGVQHEALSYMLTSKEQLIAFIRDFLLLCEFTPKRRPKRYLKCEECEYEFAKKQKGGEQEGFPVLTSGKIKIEVKNQELDYGVIICPKCDGETDTDLEIWRKAGFTFSRTQSGDSKL